METVVCYSIGQGTWAPRALLLSRSIETFAPRTDQVAFIPDGEAAAVPQEILSEIASRATIVEGELAVPEYPIISKLQAFERAAEMSTADNFVMLDTDTLVLDELSGLPPGDADLAARPANFACRQWEQGMGEALEPTLFEKFDFEFPTRLVRGTVDDKAMPACWNAAVVCTTDPDIPREWLNLTKSVYAHVPQSRFADQLALAMLATDRDMAALSERDNFPGSYRFRFPSDIRILHYRELYHLGRAFSPTLREKFERIDVPEIKDEWTNGHGDLPALKYVGTNVVHRLIGW